jgi:preprotein translocase subunit SecD
MINQYPLWKYLLLLTVVGVCVLYALPNVYGEDPSVQISALRSGKVDDALLDKVKATLDGHKLVYKSVRLVDKQLLARFNDTDTQLAAVDVIQGTLGDDYIAAINLAPATPAWLKSINALPMYLGLDLRGGVHFVLQVDMKAALKLALERYTGDFRSQLRDEKVRYVTVGLDGGRIKIIFNDAASRDKGREVIHAAERSLLITEEQRGEEFLLYITLEEKDLREVRKLALEQNITTLRKRVNELGVAEPIIQQQGEDRIVVQLPGVQDTVRAKKILGATATLEYRLVDIEHNVQEALAGRVPPASKLYKTRDGQPVLLYRRVIVTGDQITNASSGIDQTNGSPAVFVNLDSRGAKRMGDTTRENLKKPMAVVFIENKTVTRMVDGKPVRVQEQVEEVINIATIQGAFSSRFQTTGLDSADEARDLALLLRAGALAVPAEIVEERTVGPSLGQENIDQGKRAVVIGFLLVVVLMAIYYRAFGLIADIALIANLIILVAVMSMLQATLTMPGIAGIVLTLGMAVDANVLIFERIREEIANGNTPQASIHAGYEKALSTIADANITTLIAAAVLFGFGTGPIKGFAITLSIGIMTSMFTAIMGSRALANLLYGGKRVQSLSI